MKPFRVTGKFRMGRVLSPFSIETLGTDENGARDRILSTIGSRHRVNRHQITIASVAAISPDDVQDPVVSKKIAMVK